MLKVLLKTQEVHGYSWYYSSYEIEYRNIWPSAPSLRSSSGLLSRAMTSSPSTFTPTCSIAITTPSDDLQGQTEVKVTSKSGLEKNCMFPVTVKKGYKVGQWIFFFCIIFYACLMFIGSLKGRKNFKVGFLLSKNLLGLITGNRQLHF